MFDGTWEVTTSGSGTGNVIAREGTINLSAKGEIDGGFFGALSKSKPTGIAGMLATLRIDQVSGNCELGLKATIGQIGSKRIQVLIYLTEYNSEKSIQYSITLNDLTDDSSALVGSGTFGGSDGAWVLGKPQTIAFARVGSEVWFYADGFKQIQKIQLSDGITSYYDYAAGYVNAPTGVRTAITGSISDMYLYYE